MLRSLTVCGPFWSEAVQIASLRLKLQGLTQGGPPQIVLRIGLPAATALRSSRRATNAVVERAEA